jgi:zinc/manganese transport system ATP-binding protein
MSHNEIPTDLLIQGLCAGYARRTVLHDVTARFPTGRVTAVVGANGSGKSTLLGVLAGVVPAAAGRLRWPGTRRPAFVPQHSAVSAALPITVRETVAMGRWARRGPWRRLSGSDRAVVDTCMARTDVVDLAPRLLSGLSGGQRQRVLVAQALAQESDLLLLDEPATGLDRAARHKISAALDGARAHGVTVVQATHDLGEALRADYCLLLHHGRLLGQGPPEVVLTAEALDAAWEVPRLP